MFNIIIYIYCDDKSEKIIRNFLSRFNANSGVLLQSEVLVHRNKKDLYQNSLHNEWIEIKDTDSWIKLGLSEQSLAFSIYYSLPNQPINGLIISFTMDGGIVFGIEIENTETNLGYSKKLLDTLKGEYSVILGALFIEETPFLSKDLFIQALNERAIYSI